MLIEKRLMFNKKEEHSTPDHLNHPDEYPHE
jgi:hypothetical protein